MNRREGEAFHIPFTIVSRSDIGMLERELSVYIEAGGQKKLGAKAYAAPASKMLQSIASANRFDLDDMSHARTLLGNLQYLKKHAPEVHISVAAVPTAVFACKMAEWFRTKVHAYALIDIALSPSTVIGCIVRTPNTVYDFSAGGALIAGQPFIAEYIRKAFK